jgi:HemX protein
MLVPTYIALFYFGLACHFMAATAAVLFLRSTGNGRALMVGRNLLALGALALALTLVLRYVHWRHVPLTTGADSMTLFMIMVSALALVMSASEAHRGLLAFYLPPLALIGVANGVLGASDLRVSPNAADFSRVLLVIHVVLAFLAYALFFVASLTSGAYVFQARRLKHHKTGGVFLKLPSLENLDHILLRLITWGYPLFVLTLLLGGVWAWLNPDPLSPTWWWSPKILLSLLMVLFYAASYHARTGGLLRGTRLAHFVFAGFGLLLGAYLVLSVLRLTNYNFYGSAG